MASKRYTITLTESQLTVLNRALEWFFRLQMGQFSEYATEVAHNGYKYDKDDPENSEKFNAYIERRNASQDMFERAFRIAQPVLSYKTEDMMVAEDMWASIRYKLWKDKSEPKSHVSVDSYPPLHVSAEPPIGIENAEGIPAYADIVDKLRKEADNTRAHYLYSLLHNAANAIEVLSKLARKGTK